MSHLRIKIRVLGNKHQKVIRFLLVPKEQRQRSKYILSFGYWDLRETNRPRLVVLNIYKIMTYYRFGATFKRELLLHFYKYFLDFHDSVDYFRQEQMYLFLEDEIKKFYLSH